jgi:xylan 1,4-beta-xylosidase
MKVLFTALLVHVIFGVMGQYQTIPIKDHDQYYNPIFAGDYPDPSILVDGDTYYMVHSSFEYYPGLLIWKSKDLINWVPVVNSLKKYVGSVWAPDLVKYNKKYLIYFPANNTNYVISADAIEGPWSDPVDLKIGHIDPGHFADENGKRYLYFSSGNYVQLADDGLSVVGQLKPAYSGWPIPREWSIECFCMESPKITKHGDYYYLTMAEGGTAGPATSHMIISARSKSPLGPWENSPYNPIERTKERSERWWSKGHATLFEDVKGKWWMVFHAYEKGYYNMGRQTLLQPVEWTKDGWFRSPVNVTSDKMMTRPSGTYAPAEYTLSDNFNGRSLKPQWKFYGEYDTARFTLANNSLVMKGRGKSVAESHPLLTIPSNHSYTAEVELSIEGEAIGGLMLFYNQNAYSGILADDKNILANIKGWQFNTETNAIKRHVFLRLKNIEHTVDMYYSDDGTKWNKIENSLEVSGMHHNVLGGFMSLRLGLTAIGNGVVTFRNFKYTPIR